jgi:uncharacterized protein YqjF (DUF2071 family)
MTVPTLLKAIGHRPWPLPHSPWIMRQTWHDLLFAHWPISPHLMRPRVPAQLGLDLFQGQAWIGIVPFRMSHVRLRSLPPMPTVSAFPELNVRTYVTVADRPGVYFFSLDAASLGAVWAARALYHLPYFHAEMRIDTAAGRLSYSSRRKQGQAELRASYHAVSPVRLRERQSLAYWLTERYCLYTVDRGRVYRGEVHHLPWLLADAAAHFEKNTMAGAAGIALPDCAPLLHFARHQPVLIWPLRRVL